MIWNWISRRPRHVDVALVALLLVPALAASARGVRPETIALDVAGALPLLWRRQRPALVLLAVAAVAVVSLALHRQLGIAPFQLGLALYTVATISPSRTALLLGGGSVGAVVIAMAATSVLFGDGLSRIVFLVACWLFGDSIGSRRAYVREIEEKAERLEREHAAESRRAAAEEQARIARELHDVVAHALSVIVVQAAAADDVFDHEPDRARAPIRAIETAARGALGDLRRVLGALDGGTGLAPQPGLARLDALVEQVRATGLAVGLEIYGRPRPLPAAVDLSAYRIVQEALTNTLKHARAEHADVQVRFGDDLDLVISDDGRGPEANGAGGSDGSGLVGMRERVAMLGGTVAAGATPGGGFRVTARIPIAAA